MGRKEEIKENDRGGEFSYDIFGIIELLYLVYKNFCKCHRVPPPSATIKKKAKSQDTL
jgi:hypothetical protein